MPVEIAGIPHQGDDMSNFDPNVPVGALTITGEFTSAVLVKEVPAFGVGNLVLDPTQPFDIRVDWKIDGNVAELWLSALAVASPDWVVTAYAESVGPGPEKILVAQNVPVLPLPSANPPFAYSTTLTVPPGSLDEENPGDPLVSGVYKLVVTVFLDSIFGAQGYDIMGFAEGPVIKVENPI
jgi:hypothetical protein